MSKIPSYLFLQNDPETGRAKVWRTDDSDDAHPLDRTKPIVLTEDGFFRAATEDGFWTILDGEQAAYVCREHGFVVKIHDTTFLPVPGQ